MLIQDPFFLLSVFAQKLYFSLLSYSYPFIKLLL